MSNLHIDLSDEIGFDFESNSIYALRTKFPDYLATVKQETPHFDESNYLYSEDEREHPPNRANSYHPFHSTNSPFGVTVNRLLPVMVAIYALWYIEQQQLVVHVRKRRRELSINPDSIGSIIKNIDSEDINSVTYREVIELVGKFSMVFEIRKYVYKQYFPVPPEPSTGILYHILIARRWRFRVKVDPMYAFYRVLRSNAERISFYLKRVQLTKKL
jgi:hypothetical protein